jgi:dTMP kinase
MTAPQGTNPNSRGILIAVEGIDGAGKTTQVRKLVAALRTAGETVVASKEPTDGVWGRKIRESAASGRMSPDDELHAFIEDRKEHVRNLIRPGLEAGSIVILDRYYFSTLAYQGPRRGDVPAMEATMREIAPEPDIVFLLDLDPLVAISRIAVGRGEVPNHFERADSLTESRRVFLELIERHPCMRRLDATQPPDVLHRDILHRLIDGPLKTKRCAKVYGCDDWYHCGVRMANECEWDDLRKRLLLGLAQESGDGLPSDVVVRPS